jgi:uncharacterized protein (TIGR02145 family)
MKKYFFCFCVLLSVSLQGQIQQNINKPSGTVSNAIAEIDSIRFNAAGDEMQVVLIGGTVNSHSIIEIDSVTFAPAMSNLQLHTCGADSVHNPALTYGSMTDQEGNVYKTIVIGSQEWMAENLKTSTFLNGDAIPEIIENAQWPTQTSASCFYNSNNENECPYGKLYNWYAVADPRNICPTGWHVPSSEEWNVLIGFIDPSFNPNPNIGGTGLQSVNGGVKLKTIGTLYWSGTISNATNESGFSVLPSGYRDGEFGTFFTLGDYAYFWSSSEFEVNTAFSRSITTTVNRVPGRKTSGAAIRCIRD